MGALRSQRVRGPYHRRLVALLLETLAKQAGVTQDSLADAIGSRDQTTVGKRLSGKGGTFDLDEADAVLHHLGSSLKDFIADARVVPQLRRVSPVRAALEKALRSLDEDELRIVLGSAQAVRDHARRVKKQSAPPRAAAPTRIIRKTGGTR